MAVNFAKLPELLRHPAPSDRLASGVCIAAFETRLSFCSGRGAIVVYRVFKRPNGSSQRC